MLITKQFMKLPVCHTADEVTFSFFDGEKSVFTCKAKYDPKVPDHIYYCELPTYLIGCDITVKPSIRTDTMPEFCDKRPRYIHKSEKYRPKLHFTAPQS